jgi:hypothetical protein
MMACNDRHEAVDAFRGAIANAGLSPPDQIIGGSDRHGVPLEDDPQRQSREVLEPNLAAAARFLTLLDEETDEFTFATFDDDQTRNDSKLARTLIGTLDQHAAELARLNRAGAGVFVTVNATDGRGRKRENVTRVRAFWQEADQGDEPPLPIEPHIDVASSPGRHHRYFLVEGVPLDEFGAIQRCLVERYGSDRNAADLSRVLRLPGFYHQKVKPAQGRTGEPYLVRIVHESGAQPLPRERVLAIFPPVAEVASALQATTTEPVVIGSDTQRELRSALASLRSDDRDLWVRMGMALKTLGDVGRGLWIEWSQTSNKYDPADATHKWDSFEPERTGYQAVFAEAQRQGWLNPRSAKACSSSPAASEPAASTRSRVGSDAWPTPEPILAALHPVPPFEAEVLLPPVLRPWVMDTADRMPCPLDFVAAAAIVELGSLIGARCAIKPKAKDDWLVVPNLWGGIVAPPSAKKSPAIDAALKPLGVLIKRAIEAYEADKEDYETELAVFNASQDAIKSGMKSAARKSKGSKSDGAKTPAMEDLVGELKELRRGAPAAPILHRYKTNDVTVEKLGELLRDTPAGLLVMRDELVGLLASWDREGREGERAFFLEAWNGNASFDTDRIGRGSIFIPNLCVSILGGIQPDKLVGYLEQAAHALANDGMLQRFQVLVYPDDQRWEWRDRVPDKAAREAAHGVFEMLADFNPVAWGAHPADDFAKFPHFHFSEEAQQFFVEWSADLHQNRLPDEEHPLIAQHLAKYDKLFPALALILHLVDCAATRRRGPVSKEAAYWAGAWCEYLEAHARRCYGLLADDGLRAAQALADKLRHGKLADGFTARDVRRHQWRHLTTDETVRAALDWLEDEGWLRGQDMNGAGHVGRPTVTYRINPAVRALDGAGADHG